MAKKHNKRGGVVLPIILFVLIFLIATLFMPFSFAPKAKAKNEVYEYVMRDVFKNKDPLVTKIAMLGAHDAFSHNISFTSFADSNDKNIVSSKLAGAIAKGLAVRASKAQSVGAKELLYSGVRYLDARITKINGRYYTSHIYVSDTLESYVKEVVDFLDSHKGEFVIFDIQHFRTENGSNNELEDSEYIDLYNELDRIKGESGKSLLDYVFYDSSVDDIDTLTYTKVTNNRESGGVIILSKSYETKNAYYRDKDASYKRNYYYTIRSFWHETNTNKSMLEGIEYEYNYLNEHNYEGILVVNQAQKTALIANAKIITSLFEWSLLDMANNFNRVLVKDEARFKRWLTKMPIFMVDNATSMKGKFNTLANKYILEYNESL